MEFLFLKIFLVVGDGKIVVKLLLVGGIGLEIMFY